MLDLHYTVGPAISHGSYGVVRKCFHKDTETWRAVKSMKKVLEKNNAVRIKIADINNEVNMLERLQGNPSIVQMFEVFDEISNVHVVMELLEGDVLRKLVTKDNTEDVLVQVLRSIMEVIFHCHNNDIVHRDIKPDNFVYRRPDDSTSLVGIDFGCSFDLNSGFVAPMMGTMAYSAPEVCLDGMYFKKSDVWSAGAVIRELITGTRSTFLSGFYRHDDLFVNPRFVKLEPKLKSVIKRMLEFQTERRWGPAEILNELQ